MGNAGMPRAAYPWLEDDAHLLEGRWDFIQSNLAGVGDLRGTILGPLSGCPEGDASEAAGVAETCSRDK